MARLAGERLAHLFPVLAFEPDRNLFLCEGQSVGFGFDCLPLTAAEKGGPDLNVLLNQDWPTHTLLQFVLWCSPDIDWHLDHMRSLRLDQRDPVLLTGLEERIAFLRRGVEEPLSPVTGLRVRDIRLLATARLPLNGPKPTAGELDACTQLRETVQQNLKTAGLAPRVLDPEGYLRFVGTVINTGTDASWRDGGMTLWGHDQLIRDQIADYETDLEVDHRGLWLAQRATRVKVLSCKRFPERASFGGALRYLGDRLSGTRGVREPLLISANVYFPDPEASREKLEAGRAWVTNQAYGPLLKFVPGLVDRKEGYDALFSCLSDGDRVIRLYLGMVLFAADDAAAAKSVSNLRTFYRESGFQIMEDRFIALPALLNLLPLGAERGAVSLLTRYRTLATRQAVPLLPVLGDWKGTGTPAVTLLSRNGQVMSLSLFDSGSNYNVVIAAQAGSGKSFFTNDLITAYRSMGARVWVIDVGRSYQKLAQRYGGEFLAFGDSTRVCLNPFTLVRTWQEEADVLHGLVAAMAAPTQPLTDFQRAGLERVIKAVWDQHGNGTTIDPIAEALLQEPDLRITDLGHQLYPFTSQGSYGRFFNGRNNVRLDNDFVVLELEELKGRKHLQRVVLLQLIYMIQQEMYLGTRNRPKLVFVDEGWDLMSEGDVGKFIEHGYRRFRKYGGAAVTITQSVHDVYDTPGGRAIVENSANLYLLGQKATTVASLQEQRRLPLTEAGYDLLKTVHTVPGDYSEIFCLTDAGAGIGRLVVEPYNRLLYSTRAADVHALDRMVSTGMSIDEAVRYLLKERSHAA